MNDAKSAFAWNVRVYYEDTDTGGVVYYANYLKFFERCRTEWLRALGWGQQGLAQDQGLAFVVVRAEVDYLRPALLDDELRVEANIAGHGASFVVFEQQALRGAERLSRARVKVACVDAATRRPCRLPPALYTAFRALAAPGGSNRALSTEPRA